MTDPTRPIAPMGHLCGPMTPCENPHTIHRDGLRFWLTCGDEEIGRATFTESSIDYQEEPRHWSSRVLLQHEIACWKAINQRLCGAVLKLKDYETRTRPHLVLNDDGEFMWTDDLFPDDFVIWSDPSMVTIDTESRADG